eukprot:7379201-Prymnesium_polylepis.2
MFAHYVGDGLRDCAEHLKFCQQKKTMMSETTNAESGRRDDRIETGTGVHARLLWLCVCHPQEAKAVYMLSCHVMYGLWPMVSPREGRCLR